MNKVAAKIINTLLLASLLASYRDDAEDTNEYVYTIVSNNVDQLTKSNARVMKNVIKLGKNGKLTLIAGRRSHYSHRSHYSGRRSRCSSFHSVLEYTIGERTLTEGMYGSDVDMLVSILQGKGFKTNRIKKHQGLACYDSHLSELIKRIQITMGVMPTGICDRDFLDKLL